MRDAATLLGVMAGKDRHDATSLDADVPDYAQGLEAGVQGLRIGVLAEAFGEGVEPDVAASVHAGVDRLAGLGAEVGEASLPHAEYALSAYYLIAPSEASSNLARYDGVRYGLRVDGDDSIEMMFRTRGAGFGPEVKRRIMLGTYALSAGYYEAYYGQAQKVRTLILQDYAAAFERFDVLVSPTSPTTAFPIGAKADDPLAMYLNDIFTIPANLGGVPAISVPCGLDANGLPIGLQLTAPALEESTLFRAAHTLESDLGLDLGPAPRSRLRRRRIAGIDRCPRCCPGIPSDPEVGSCGYGGTPYWSSLCCCWRRRVRAIDRQRATTIGPWSPPVAPRRPLADRRARERRSDPWIVRRRLGEGQADRGIRGGGDGLGGRSLRATPQLSVRGSRRGTVRLGTAGRPRAPWRPRDPGCRGRRSEPAGDRSARACLRLGPPPRPRPGVRDLRFAPAGEAVHGRRARRSADDLPVGRYLHIAYHPSGLALAFVVDRGGRQRIWLSTNEGLDPVPLVFSKGGTRFTSIAFTPDGQHPRLDGPARGRLSQVHSMDLADRTGFTDGWRGEIGQAAWKLAAPALRHAAGLRRRCHVRRSRRDDRPQPPGWADLLCPMPIGPRPRWGALDPSTLLVGVAGCDEAMDVVAVDVRIVTPVVLGAERPRLGDHGRRSHRGYPLQPPTPEEQPPPEGVG